MGVMSEKGDGLVLQRQLDDGVWEFCQLRGRSLEVGDMQPGETMQVLRHRWRFIGLMHHLFAPETVNGFPPAELDRG